MLCLFYRCILGESGENATGLVYSNQCNQSAPALSAITTHTQTGSTETPSSAPAKTQSLSKDEPSVSDMAAGIAANLAAGLSAETAASNSAKKVGRFSVGIIKEETTVSGTRCTLPSGTFLQQWHILYKTFFIAF